MDGALASNGREERIVPEAPKLEAVPPETIAMLRETDSPTIANAIERFKVRDRCDGFIGGRVRCLFPDLGRMVGHALTVTMSNAHGPVASRDGFWRMFEALAQMPKPSILAVQDISGAPNRVALCGEVMATLARRLGAVGYVTDGAVRDVEEVRALGLHYFAGDVVVSHANFWIADVGVPINLDGQTIRTGDLLHGDANGIVVVPTEVLPDLPDAIATVRRNERELMDFIDSADFTLDGAKKLTGYR
jgi:4-hydroxy-4-methyl-2-oxoglutarate aldolase